MSKILDLYNRKKMEDNDKKYMFKGGVFYYFIDADARYLSDKYNLKLTAFGNSVKCGFPIKSLEKYLNIFTNENIVLVDEVNNYANDIIINKIKNIWFKWNKSERCIYYIRRFTEDCKWIMIWLV